MGAQVAREGLDARVEHGLQLRQPLLPLLVLLLGVALLISVTDNFGQVYKTEVLSLSISSFSQNLMNLFISQWVLFLMRVNRLLWRT